MSADASAPALHPDRITQLSGGHNFRDIGGYPTHDGRTVAWGRIYRSGTLAALADTDHAVLDALGIRVICDLRSSRERASRPSRLNPAASLDVWSREHETSTGDLVRAMGQPGATAAMSHDLMIELYGTLAYEQAPSYREVFRRIAAGDLPLVFHCSAGKDRTGIAAALLLDLLGVDRATIIEDYVLTDLCFEKGCKLVRDDPSTNRLKAIAPHIWEPMMRADRTYLQKMFDVLTAQHGSLAGFLRDEVGVDEPMTDKIRENLLIHP